MPRILPPPTGVTAPWPRSLWQALVIAGILCWAIGGGAAPGAQATDVQTADPVAARRAEIDRETAAVAQMAAELKAERATLEQRLARIGQAPVSESEVEKARIDMETVQVDAASAQMDLVAARHRIKVLQSELSEAQDRLTKLQTAATRDPQTLAAAQAELARRQALLALERQHVQNLSRRLELAQEKVEDARRLWQALQEAYRSRQALERKESLADLEQRLHKAQQDADRKAAELRARLAQISGDDLEAVARRHLLTIQIEQTLDEVFLLRTTLALEQARSELQGLPVAAPDAHAAPEELEHSIELLDGIEKGLQPILDLIHRKQELLSHEMALLRRNSAIEQAAGAQQYRIEKDALRSLIDRFQAQADAVNALIGQIDKQRTALQAAYQAASARSLTSRQRLPHDPQAWARIAVELERLPATVATLATSMTRDLFTAWRRADLPSRLLVAVLELLWAGLILGLGRLRRPPMPALEPAQSFSAKARTVSVALLRGLRWILLPGGALVLAGWTLHITQQNLELLLLLAAVAVGAYLIIGLSRWVFTSALIPPEKRQSGVHRGVVGVTLAITVLVILDGLGRLGYLSSELAALVERLFMVLLLPLASLSLRLRALLMGQVREQWRSVFWVNLLGLASFAVPLVMLAASVLGLAGYVNLAWFLAGRLALILLVFLVWAVFRHLVIDLAAVLRERAQTRPRRAGLLIGGLIEPGQAIARLLLFLGALWSLGVILGWDSGTGIGGMLRAWLDHPLFSVGGAPIDLLDVFGALIYLGITIYLGIWMRRLSFDWLYVRIQDRGLRNSLAIFTQYAIILLGVLIGFNLLHINLTSLTVFAGALGVGIGFGLQNIANNFVSGLILLVERPVRIHDWVTVGDREGKVSRIGIRALTVTTWDNQDVIIPNANLISDPFTNWTLSDTLVRSIFVVGIRYQDDPHQAQKVILDAVAMQPEVSLERPPRVLLTEFNSSSVDFRVEFYTDVANVGQYYRLEVKSKVMFAIWDGLKEADIGIPFPQRDIYIKELPEAREVARPALLAPSPSGADRSAPSQQEQDPVDR